MQHFHARTVWITGASAGLGAELARQLADQKARLVLSARRVDRLEALVAECEARGGSARALPLDVTDDVAVAAATRSIEAVEGSLDVTIANAGFGVSGPFRELTTNDWRRQFEVNLMGLVSTANASLPLLARGSAASGAPSDLGANDASSPADHPDIQQTLESTAGSSAPIPPAKPNSRGRLVLIGSVAAFLPGPGVAPYSASKAAVRSLVQSLALELRPTGVSVTGIYPGYVESEIRQVDNQGQFDAARPDLGPHRLYWPTDRAARVMLRAIHARKREFTFTAHGRVAGWLGRHMPGLLHHLAARRF